MRTGAVIFLLACGLVAASPSIRDKEQPHDPAKPLHVHETDPRDRVSPSNPDLCRAPTLIVFGRVEAKESYFGNDEGQSVIMSDVRFGVDRTIYGQPSSEILLTILGGEVGHKGELVSGVPRMKLGEHWLLFLADREGWPTPIILQYQFIPDDPFLRLLDEDLLRGVWNELCSVHPEGIARNSRLPMSELLELSMPAWFRRASEAAIQGNQPRQPVDQPKQ